MEGFNKFLLDKEAHISKTSSHTKEISLNYPLFGERPMNKILPVLIASTAIFYAIPGSAQETLLVKIGYAGPKTGNTAHIGKDAENGARMAIDEANLTPLTINGKQVKFELLGEDDAADPKQGTAAAQKLVDSGVAGVIGHVNSGTTIPASKIYADAGIPQISPSATNTKYTEQGYRTAFRVVANDAQLGGTLGRYAVDVLKAKRIAVIDDRSAYGQGLAQQFVTGVRSKGQQSAIVSQQFTTNQAIDFAAILTQIKSKLPEVIFYGGTDAQAGPMLRQMKQLGINAKVLGGDGICTLTLIDLAGDGLNDDQVICAEPGGIEKGREARMAAFKDAYRKKFGIDVQIYAPYAYDATKVLINAMSRAKSVDPVKFSPLLASTRYDGVTGQIDFDQKGDLKEGALTLYSYAGGKRKIISVLK